MEKKTRIIFGVVLACLLLGGALFGLVVTTLTNTPDFSSLKASVEQDIIFRDGSKGTRLVGPAASSWVPLPQISKALVMAVVSSEDSAFFQHEGLDLYEIQESLKKDIQEKRFARGGSTITQQVVKNLYLSHQKSLWRKLKEMIWAGQLEKALTKSEILTLYLNLIEWGPGIYGVKQAASHYFGKSPGSISAREAAFLALLIPSPVRRYEYFQEKKLTKWAESRMGQILRVMYRMSFIDESTYRIALNESLWGEGPIPTVDVDADLGNWDMDIARDNAPLEGGEEDYPHFAPKPLEAVPVVPSVEAPTLEEELGNEEF